MSKSTKAYARFCLQNMYELGHFATHEKIDQPIGDNDLNIAAHARSEGLILVTNNEREFTKVPCLQLKNWLVLAAR